MRVGQDLHVRKTGGAQQRPYLRRVVGALEMHLGKVSRALFAVRDHLRELCALVERVLPEVVHVVDPALGAVVLPEVTQAHRSVDVEDKNSHQDLGDSGRARQYGENLPGREGC